MKKSDSTNDGKVTVRNYLIESVLALFIVGVLVLLGLVFFTPARTYEGEAKVTVRVSENVAQISPYVVVGDDIFINGSNGVATITDVRTVGSELLVTIEAPGRQEAEVFDFNGQRVLVGQKAELHGKFFARGKIESFTYEK